MRTYDSATISSTGAFLVGQLEKLNPKINNPLLAYTFGRDLPLRTDASMAFDVTSFTKSTFGTEGTEGNSDGLSLIGKNSTEIATTQTDIQKIAYPLYLWGQKIGWTIPELMAAQQLGQSIDTQKLDALRKKWNMDLDQVAYVGAESLNIKGLANLDEVTPTNATREIIGASPTEALAMINGILTQAWEQSAWSVVPEQLLVPPSVYAYLNSTIVSNAGNQSILSFLKINCLSTAENNKPLEILPVKWLAKAGIGRKGRIVAYTRNPDYLAMPIVQLMGMPLFSDGLFQTVTYAGKFGAVQPVYPETIAYLDGVSPAPAN